MATGYRLKEYLSLRLRAIRAEVDLIGQQIEELEQQPTELPTKFDPDWKHNDRLTTRGQQALEQAFAAGMRQSEVARLFKISMTRAHVLHKEWKRKAAANGGAEGAGHD